MTFPANKPTPTGKNKGKSNYIATEWPIRLALLGTLFVSAIRGERGKTFMKYLLAFLLLLPVSSPAASIIQGLSSFNSTNHLATNDLIAVATQPGTASEKLRGMTYAAFRSQMSTNLTTYGHTNYFGSIPIREPSWVWDGTRSHLYDSTNMEVMTLRHNDAPVSGNSIFHNVIYFGGSGNPAGVGADFSAFSLQVAGGLSQAYGNPRISFVMGDDQFTWRWKELHVEDSLNFYGWDSDQLVIGHQLLSHNNAGDLWLATMGTRTITFTDPTLMTNQLITLIINSYDSTTTNNYIALGTNPTVTWGTNFLIASTAAATAANFVGCISNIFDLFAFQGSLGFTLSASRSGAVVSLYQLSGTRNITPSVGTGMTTSSGTNGTVTTLGSMTAGTYLLTGTTNQVSFGATNKPPASTVAPTKWISVQVSGDSTAYRLPLYQ